jgi:hypothetical protein
MCAGYDGGNVCIWDVRSVTHCVGDVLRRLVWFRYCVLVCFLTFVLQIRHTAQAVAEFQPHKEPVSEVMAGCILTHLIGNTLLR